MKKVVALGSEAFTLGFQLSGIRKIVNIHDNKDILDKIHELRQDKDIGIVIVDENILQKLESHDRSEIEESVEPVFISLSTESSSENIRKLIIKSIGVDLWKGE